MVLARISVWLIPLLLAGTALYALWRRVDVFSALCAGAGEGLSVTLRILPALTALLTGVYMLRASGAMELLAGLLTPILTRVGIPPETVGLLLIRPVSGSGALAVGSEIMQTYGPDSTIGRTAAVMLGSTETTFYTVAVYYGAARIRRTRHTIPAALAADITGFLAAAWMVRWMFRGLEEKRQETDFGCFCKKYSILNIEYRIYTNYTLANTISQEVSAEMERFFPKKQEKEVISIRISTDLLATVDRKSASFDISRNEFINQCIVFALKHMEDNA